VLISEWLCTGCEGEGERGREKKRKRKKRGHASGCVCT
jgi:ribosome assembly protein YihI (activator of Der GTPase)